MMISVMSPGQRPKRAQAMTSLHRCQEVLLETAKECTVTAPSLENSHDQLALYPSYGISKGIELSRSNVFPS